MGARQSAQQKLMKQQMDLKMTAKGLNRESTKCEKDVKENKRKCKQAMEKGNMEGARIYAENAIRLHNQSLNYLKLSSRVDAVAARVKTAAAMSNMARKMAKINVNMEDVMKNMNIEQIAQTMDTFEQQFEDMDITSQYMEKAMDQSTAANMPESQVENLMSQIADENGLEFQSQMDAIGNPQGQLPHQQQADKDDEKELEARLKKLNGI